MYDFFISYRRIDSSDFSRRLADSLRSLKYDVWLDERELRPGQHIEETIFEGVRSCVAGVLVFSKTYFEGWSNREKEYFLDLSVRKRVDLIPVYYGIDKTFVDSVDPRLTEVLAITADSNDTSAPIDVANQVAAATRKETRRSRLFEFFFKAVREHEADPDLDLWLALFDNDTDRLKKALDAGADANLTDIALYNRYAKAYATKCFEEFRRLYLYLNGR
jgi:hypothetical protein